MKSAHQTDTAAPFRSLLTACVAIGALIQGAAADESIAVRAVPLEGQLRHIEYSAPASVVALDRPKLATEVDGRIIEVLVDVGDRVSSGDLLARLDCRRYLAQQASATAALERAQAQRRFAAQQLARARDLKRNKNISEELLDQRRRDLDLAEADLDSQRQALTLSGIDVGDCELRAPLDAVVSERQASVGDYATRGKVIVALVATAGLEVSVALRDDQVSGLQNSTKPQFVSNGARYPLRLRSIVPVADTLSRTRVARLVFTGQAADAGTAGRVVWRNRRGLLPAEHLVRRDDQLGVFILRDGRAAFVPIADAQEGRPSAIDLEPQTLLITEGRQRLQHGTEVSLINNTEQAE